MILRKGGITYTLAEIPPSSAGVLAALERAREEVKEFNAFISVAEKLLRAIEDVERNLDGTEKEGWEAHHRQASLLPHPIYNGPGAAHLLRFFLPPTRLNLTSRRSSSSSYGTSSTPAEWGKILKWRIGHSDDRPTVIVVNGRVISDTERVAAYLATQAFRLAGAREGSRPAWSGPRLISEWAARLADPPSDDELKDAFLGATSNTPGPGGVPLAFLRHTWELVCPAARVNAEGCVKRETFPKAFKQATVALSRSPGRSAIIQGLEADHSAVEFRQGVERLLARRITAAALNSGLLPPDVAGAVPSRSALDLIQALVHDAETMSRPQAQPCDAGGHKSVSDDCSAGPNIFNAVVTPSLLYGIVQLNTGPHRTGVNGLLVPSRPASAWSSLTKVANAALRVISRLARIPYHGWSRLHQAASDLRARPQWEPKRAGIRAWLGLPSSPPKKRRVPPPDLHRWWQANRPPSARWSRHSDNPSRSFPGSASPGGWQRPRVTATSWSTTGGSTTPRRLSKSAPAAGWCPEATSFPTLSPLSTTHLPAA
ncbi:uncharacterized protein CTHT_0000560 [Thermochaetoides thermophila DSM 1495]|uniref:Uncharacterized protein n=1 Tax=Chaetomium thermophilum (strain DSM 1495 / CBS 144.50 / IMI 039719) TaxID=759272 RepID=G0RYU0_CHATD|nr:hypothetical protein CTHT_0000560 [Thermochaetoides thermophila DSM 1495]EGS23368.1 hypothetical protein CTHT_0000560 [Thermochaetoides thermophila DSM 1495]